MSNRAILALAALALLVPAGAAADVLVLRDGSRVTTRGPWQERGAVVVFYLADGTLSSLRVTQIDLDASRAATEAAKAPKAPPAEAEPAERKPAVVLTDADVRQVDPSTLPAWQRGEGDWQPPGEAADEGAAPEEEAAAAPRLQVVDWQEEPGAAGGVSIIGTVVNGSSEVTGNLDILVELVDEEGNLIANSDAVPSARTLLPGQRTTFRARFPGVFHFTTVRFETEHLALRTGGTEDDEDVFEETPEEAGEEVPEAE